MSLVQEDIYLNLEQLANIMEHFIILLGLLANKQIVSEQSGCQFAEVSFKRFFVF